MLSWIFILVAHWNNSLQVDMLLHSDSCWLLLLLNGASLEQQISMFIVFGFTLNRARTHDLPHLRCAWFDPAQSSNSWSTTLEECMVWPWTELELMIYHTWGVHGLTLNRARTHDLPHLRCAWFDPEQSSNSWSTTLEVCMLINTLAMWF